MSVNNINSINSTTAYNPTSTPKKNTETPVKNTTENPAVVYEPSKDDKPKKTYKKDAETVNRLLKDMESRKQQLKDLVAKTLQKQGETYNSSMNIFDVIKSGKLELSAEDIAQAKEDVSEDGYWGVEQTSERIYSFAYALTGGDPSKADEMLKAVEKGFKLATKDWGDELPDISQKTMDAVREKFKAWQETGVEA